jgi:hypothetical protein
MCTRLKAVGVNIKFRKFPTGVWTQILSKLFLSGAYFACVYGIQPYRCVCKFLLIVYWMKCQKYFIHTQPRKQFAKTIRIPYTHVKEGNFV